jgi:O-antigen ligase
MRRTATAALLLLPVAWGAVLFGAVYPWTYIPLLVAVTAVGLYGWSTASARDRQPARGVAAALALVMAIVVLQLVPLPPAWLARVSPKTPAALQQYDLTFAAAQAGDAAPWRPISIAPAATLRGLAFLAALGTLLVGATALMPRVPVTWMVRRVAVLGLVLAELGLVLRATFNGRIYWVWAPINSAGNVFGPFVNRNHFAGWLLMAAALTAGYACALVVRQGPARHRTWRERLAALSSKETNRLAFCGCALVVMTLAIVWTLSRSGIASLAVATCLLSATVLVRFRGGRRAATAGFLLSLVVVAVGWKGAATVADWYSRTNTLEWRVQLWRDTWPIVRDFRWLGTGLNTYGVSTLLYPMTDPTTHAREAHSDYVQIVSEGGLVLAAAALVVLWQVARGIRAGFAQPQSRSAYWVRAGATVGLAAMAVQELVDFSLQVPGNAVLFALLAAIALHQPARVDRLE